MFTLGMMVLMVPIAIGIVSVLITRRLSWSAKVLYINSLVFEVPGVIIRTFFGAVASLVLLTPLWLLGAAGVAMNYFMTGEVTSGFVLAAIAGVLITVFGLLCGVGPVIASILSLWGLRGGGDRVTRFVMRARRMSRREEQEYVQALSQLPKSITVFSQVYVCNWPLPIIQVIGTTAYMGKPLLHGSKHLPAVLAQSLGYVNSADGHLIGALRRLVVPPLHLLAWAGGQTAPGNMLLKFMAGNGADSFALPYFFWGICSFVGGGWGEWLLSFAWADYWRKAQLRHDAFAAHIGQRQGLIAYLEHFALYGVATPHFFSKDTDPELRIDALMYPKTATAPSTLTPANQP